MFFRDGSMDSLLRGLDLAALRQRVIAHNLANLNTPGFKRSFVSFTETLGRAMALHGGALKTTHPRHLGGPEPGEPQVRVERNTARRPDGNNVDLEREMLEMVENQLRYNALVQLINSRFNSWRYVINEGRR